MNSGSRNEGQKKIIKLTNNLNNYFFEPQSPISLSLSRIAIFGLLFWKSLSHPWFIISHWPAEFLERTAVQEIPYVTENIIFFLTVVLAIFSFLGMLGLYSRCSAAICFIILYLLNAIDGGAYDSGWLLFSFLLLIICSRSEDHLSIKNLFAHKSSTLPAWEYRWPLRVMQLTFILVYFQNGINKLLQSGFSWLKPEVLQGWYFFHLWTDSY